MAGMTSGPDFLETVGERYRDFIVTKVLYVQELQCTLRELQHEKSGAQVMHIACDDPENVFCLSFKTLPSSSDGAPHILEHTVLCGSRKFPVKDPFFAMTRRSLNTFMNALTGADFTCYPAASQVEKDFYNLFDVYLDAVFHPELRELSFLQEGHRLEFSNPKDYKSPLLRKGIVYNEMKGSLASADARLWHATLESLVPDLPYAYNSGGDPKVIPHLTYADLIAFHETFYHPSRCLFFFYGNLPLKRHLDFIADKALKNVLKEPPLPPIPLQRRFSKPVEREMRYPIQETEDLSSKTNAVWAWLTAPLIEQHDVLALCVLDLVLMDTDASLLKLPLLQSGLCVQAEAYMDIEMSEVPYAIVCKGCKRENIDALEKVLLDSLSEIIRTGIPHHLTEAAIHQLEFARTEISGDQAPFGLTLFMRSALAKQHGCVPEDALMIHSLFEDLRKRIQDPHYLTGLLEKYLLGNTHRLRLILNPDPKLNSEEVAEEKKILKRIQEELTEKQIAHILEQTEALEVYQKQTENQSLDCLPKVTLDDVPLLSREIPLKEEKHHSLRVFHHDCFTNHILYADLIFDLPAIAEEDLPYVHLLTTLLTEVGCGKRNYAANLEYIQEHTGGLGAACALHIQAQDPHLSKPSLSIRGKALRRNAGALFVLMREMATSARFDEKKRIEELLLQLNSSLQNRLNRNALRYAIQLALSGFSSASYVGNSWYGLKYFKAIQEITKNLSSGGLSKLIEKLLSLKDQLFCLEHPHLVLSCSEEMYEEVKKEDFYGLAHLPAKGFKVWDDHYPISAIASQARVIASPVAFTAEAFKTISYLHPHAPALGAATHLFENKILLRKVREQGGAYGSSASFNAMVGNFYFHAYRDPHIASTLKAFHTAIDSIAAGNFDARDLEEAKLGIIQQLDMPTAPGSKALTAYSWWREGKTQEIRQNYRNRILDLTPKEVRHAVEVELLPKKSSGIVVTFAGLELIEKENALLAGEGKPLPVLEI
jgi:Zn-dependent M16 (insulinase) family peptidase